ncbi:unnamed protein product [Ectocarpus sp. 4 AP-2014]
MVRDDWNAFLSTLISHDRGRSENKRHFAHTSLGRRILRCSFVLFLLLFFAERPAAGRRAMNHGIFPPSVLHLLMIRGMTWGGARFCAHVLPYDADGDGHVWWCCFC